MPQVIYTEILFDGRDAVHHVFEPAVAEEFVFLSFKILPELAIFVGRDDLVKSREENRILPGSLRVVHADEQVQGVGKCLSVLGAAGGSGHVEALTSRDCRLTQRTPAIYSR